VQRDLRRTVEPDIDDAGTATCRRVSLHRAVLPRATAKAPRQSGIERERDPAGQTDLPAMRVATQHQIKAGSRCGGIDFRCVRQQDRPPFRPPPGRRARDVISPKKMWVIDTGKVKMIVRDFPIGGPAYAAAMMAQNLGLADVALHPAQLYAAIYGLLIFAVLVGFEPRLRKRGATFGMLLVLYGIARFSVDFVRFYEENARVLFGLTFNQVISVVLFGLGIVLVFRKTHLTNDPRPVKES